MKLRKLKWRPTAKLDVLRKRAEFTARIQAFFAQRSVMEVETPLLCSSEIGHPEIQLFQTTLHHEGDRRRMFLRTSPESPMKRLVAAQSGPIFQLTKAFRNGDKGSQHSPEFTILEWYRPGYSLEAMMGEVADLVALVMPSQEAHDVSYRDAMRSSTGLDPLEPDPRALTNALLSAGHAAPPGDDVDELLESVMDGLVQPHLGHSGPCFVHSFPAGQASLAQLSADDPRTADRFELFIDGHEIANGYVELTDPVELRERLEDSNEFRRKRGLAVVPVDDRLIAATRETQDRCSGVAVGVDRLFARALRVDRIQDVLAFDVDDV